MLPAFDNLVRLRWNSAPWPGVAFVESADADGGLMLRMPSAYGGESIYIEAELVDNSLSIYCR